MTHGFLDQRSLPDSLLRRTDPRWKLLLFVGAAVIVASEPRGELAAFPAYLLLVALLALLGRVRARSWALRCLAAVPFLALAAVLPLLADSIEIAAVDWSASILLRGFATVALLALLAETTDLAEIIGALQRFRLPAVWITSLALSYRYLFLLVDEWRRVGHARSCRAPSLSGLTLTGVMSQQLGLVFIRAWERAERIHGAMMVRGFDGSWPVAFTGQGSMVGLYVCWAFLLSFLVVRSST